MGKTKELFDKLHDEHFLQNNDNTFSDSMHFNSGTRRPDLYAFLVLDKLVPGDTDIISASEHDEYYLDINIEELDKVIKEEDVIELCKCGVMWHDEFECLYMFS